jgi:hypothetical protein
VALQVQQGFTVNRAHFRQFNFTQGRIAGQETVDIIEFRGDVGFGSLVPGFPIDL